MAELSVTAVLAVRGHAVDSRTVAENTSGVPPRRIVIVCHAGKAVCTRLSRTSDESGRASAAGGGTLGSGDPLLREPAALSVGAGVPVRVAMSVPPQRNEIGTAVSVRIINTGADHRPMTLCQLNSRAFAAEFWRNQMTGETARHDQLRGIHR